MNRFLASLLALTTCTCAFAFDGPARTLDETWDGTWAGNAILFSPYRHGQSPAGEHPSDDQIAADLQLVIPHWHFLRLADCGAVTETTLRLLKEKHLPARTVITANLRAENDEDTPRNDAEVAAAIRLALTYPEQVGGVIVGSGNLIDVSKIKVTRPTLLRYLRQVRATIPQPISTCDDAAFWFRPDAKEIADEIDFISLKLHPVFNGRFAEECLGWADVIYDDLGDRYAGKVMIVAETGWATQSDPLLKAAGEDGAVIKGDTSVKGQSVYLKDYYRWVRLNKVFTVLMEAFDQDWRGDSEHPKQALKHFGIFDENRHAKASFDSTVRLFPEDEAPK